MTQLESITQQNAALVEQIAASAVSLQAQSQTVTEAVRVFRIGDETPAPDAVALRKAQRAQTHG